MLSFSAHRNGPAKPIGTREMVTGCKLTEPERDKVVKIGVHLHI